MVKCFSYRELADYRGAYNTKSNMLNKILFILIFGSYNCEKQCQENSSDNSKNVPWCLGKTLKTLDPPGQCFLTRGNHYYYFFGNLELKKGNFEIKLRLYFCSVKFIFSVCTGKFNNFKRSTDMGNPAPLGLDQ